MLSACSLLSDIKAPLGRDYETQEPSLNQRGQVTWRHFDFPRWTWELNPESQDFGLRKTRHPKHPQGVWKSPKAGIQSGDGEWKVAAVKPSGERLSLKLSLLQAKEPDFLLTTVTSGLASGLSCLALPLGFCSFKDQPLLLCRDCLTPAVHSLSRHKLKDVHSLREPCSGKTSDIHLFSNFLDSDSRY